MDLKQSVDTSIFGPGLGIIRRRRWYLWCLILVYLPATVTTLQRTQSLQATGFVFLIWLVLLCIAVALTAIAKCPQCGNNFHMYNSSLHYPRKCRHCGLHLNADKK